MKGHSISGESTIGRAPRYCGQDQGARRRRCGDIVDDEQRRDCPQYLGRPKGSGAEGASAALALLDDIPVSPASRRLASAPPALGTRPIVLSPRAARHAIIASNESAVGGIVLLQHSRWISTGDKPAFGMSQIGHRTLPQP
jgi:hypothetical protein